MAGKVLVILAAVAGVVAFFVPLLDVEQNGRRGRFELLAAAALGTLGGVLGSIAPEPRRLRLPPPDARAVV